MKRLLAVQLALSAVGLCWCAGAAAQTPAGQPASGGQLYELRARYTLNEVLKYRMRMSVSITMAPAASTAQAPPAVDTVADMGLQMKTVGMLPDGTAVVVVKTTDARTTVNGQSVPMNELPVITMEVSPQGKMKVRKMEGMGSGQVASRFVDLSSLPGISAILPDKPVRAGDTWQSAVPLPLMGASSTIHMTSTLVGPEVVGSQNALRVAQVAEAPIEMRIGQNGQPTSDASTAAASLSGHIRTEGFTDLLPANARVVRSEQKATGQIVMELSAEAAKTSTLGGKATMHMTMSTAMNLISVTHAQPPTKMVKPASGGTARRAR